MHLNGKLALFYGTTIKFGKTKNFILKNKVVLVIEQHFEHVKAIYVNEERKIKIIRIRTTDLFPIKPLYPEILYIKEPSINREGDSEEPKDTQTCSYYARRGSHWVPYHIDPSKNCYYIDQENLPDYIDEDFYDKGSSSEEIELLKAHYSTLMKIKEKKSRDI